jgi:hypothetical protein
MKKFLFALLLAFAFFVSAFAQAGGKVSLIVKYSPKKRNTYDLETVEKFEFQKGKLVARKSLFTANTRKEGWITGIERERYVRTSNYTINGWRPLDEKVFDLKTETFVERKIFPMILEDEKKFREIKSPDGKKSVILKGLLLGADKLKILIEGKPDLIIKESFEVTVAESSSMMPSLPLMWLDDERVLTQKQNGKLVIVTLDGKVSPFLELPCDRDDYPQFRKTKAGKLLYVCSGDEYRIDAANRKFEKTKKDLDYDFSEDFLDKENVYYYKDEEIGRGGLSHATIENYLAVTDGTGQNGFYNFADIDTIKVWNSFTRQWTTYKIDGGFTSILGWLEQ